MNLKPRMKNAQKWMNNLNNRYNVTDISANNFTQNDIVLYPNADAVSQGLGHLPMLATPAEVAAVLRCTKRHVQKECAYGRLSHIMVAGRFLITPDAVRKYLEDRTIECQKEIQGHILNGAPKGNVGKLSGSNVEKDAAVRRARQITLTLKQSLRTSSTRAKPSARVIPLKG